MNAQKASQSWHTTNTLNNWCHEPTPVEQTRDRKIKLKTISTSDLALICKYDDCSINGTISTRDQAHTTASAAIVIPNCNDWPHLHSSSPLKLAINMVKFAMQCRWGDTHTMSIFRAAVDIALLFLSSDPCNNLDPALLLLFHISMWPAVTCMNNAYLSVTHCQHKETSMYACACAENPLGYSGPWGEICAVIYLLNLAALMCIVSILVEAALLYTNGVIRNASITQGEQESSPNAIPPWVVIKITQEQQKSPHSKLEQARLNTATSPRPKGGGEAPQFTSRGGNPITTRNRITGVPST